MNILIIITNYIIFSLAIIVISSCSRGWGGGETYNGQIKVTAIAISPQNPSVRVGAPLQLRAAITPENAENKAVSWASSDSATINVSDTGLVTANVDAGSVTITATAQDGSEIKGSTTVTAAPNKSIKVTAIAISPQNPSVARGGDPVQLTATITPSNATNKAVVWVSSDSAIISVSNMGLVTAKGESGNATITATAQDGSEINGSTTVTAVPFCTTATPCLHVISEAGNGDGTSWATPLSGLQTALDKAKAQLAQTNNKPSAVRILLKNGVYRPSRRENGTACNADTAYSDCSFTMQNNVEIYGGFAGTEASLADRVLNATTTTTLDGLLNPSTAVTACSADTVNVKCSRRVISNDHTVAISLNPSAILDGVVVKNGRGETNVISYGGGMYNANASPTIRNVTFSGNFAGNGGGILNINLSYPSLTNVTFSGNVAGVDGGGMSNFKSSPRLINVTFSDNAARRGGGMSNADSSPLLINVTFLGNSATTVGSKNMSNRTNSLPIFANTLVWGDGIWDDVGRSYSAYFSLIQGMTADDNGNLNGVTATTADIFGDSTLADNGNPLAQTIAIASNSPAASRGALVWKSGADYYASKGDDIFKLTGTGQGKIAALPAGATLVSNGGANKNNTVTPTAGPPAIYPDLGAYQH